MWRTRHVSDGDLLLLDEDGALSARRRSAVDRHVAACPRCAARRADLGAALAEAAAGCRETLTGASPLHVAGARLRAAMEARPTSRPLLAGRSLPGRFPAGWPRAGGPLGGRPSRLAAAAAAAVAVAAAAVAVLSGPPAHRPDGRDRPGVGNRGPGGEGAPALPRLERPREDLTPGRVLPVGVDEICGAGGVTGLPAVAAQVPRQVFEAYGVDFRRAAEYELDFLITPELGGAPDPRNLWPQPYRAGVWNAYVKDELERELRDLVCRGTLDLATAQRELANDWIASYKRRFNTDRPLRDYGRFPLAPDEVEAWRSELAERRFLPAGWSLASALAGVARPVYATAADRPRFAEAGG